MFKKQTHNHPTEIEPFGGPHPASAAHQDPLSGRAKTKQAMRVPEAGIRDHLKDHCRKACPKNQHKGRRKANSSYGNQVGLAPVY
jgi:phosphoribosylformylglycinamidine (FGAM) synthase-like enzyme